MTTYAVPCFTTITAMPVMSESISITATILNLLAEQPRKVIDLADMLDCTVAQISGRLRRLEAVRKVQSQRVINPKGKYFLWHIGSGKKLPTLYLIPETPVEEEEEDPTAGQPIRKMVSTWEPLKLRNEFETYFHGPARREAA